MKPSTTTPRSSMVAFVNAARAFLHDGVEPSFHQIAERTGLTRIAVTCVAADLRRKGIIATERRYSPPVSRMHVTRVVGEVQPLCEPVGAYLTNTDLARWSRVADEAARILANAGTWMRAGVLRRLLIESGHGVTTVVGAMRILRESGRLDPHPPGMASTWYRITPRPRPARPPLWTARRSACPTRTPGWRRADAYLNPSAKWVLPCKPEATGYALTQVEIRKRVAVIKAAAAALEEAPPMGAITETATYRVRPLASYHDDAAPGYTAPVRVVEVAPLVPDAELAAELRALFNEVQKDSAPS